MRAALTKREGTIADLACEGATTARAANVLKVLQSAVTQGRAHLVRTAHAALASEFGGRFGVEAAEFVLEDSAEALPAQRMGRRTNWAKHLEQLAQDVPQSLREQPY